MNTRVEHIHWWGVKLVWNVIAFAEWLHFQFPLFIILSCIRERRHPRHFTGAFQTHVYFMFGCQAQIQQGFSCGSCPHTVTWMSWYKRARSRRSLSQTHLIARSVCAYAVESALFDRVSAVEKMFADRWHNTDCPSVDQCTVFPLSCHIMALFHSHPQYQGETWEPAGSKCLLLMQVSVS